MIVRQEFHSLLGAVVAAARRWPQRRRPSPISPRRWAQVRAVPREPHRRRHAHRLSATPLRRPCCAAKRIGSDEDLWTGQVMKFLSVGGNARANYNWQDVPHQRAPTNSTVEEARAYLDFGVIPNRLSVYIDQRFAPGNSTNMEANVRYWIKESALYVKAGRMYLPFGYRFEDDNAFVRQLSGINMQAPDEGVEFGIEHGSWTAQVALSNGAGGGTESRQRQAGRDARRVRAVDAGAAARACVSTTPTPAIAVGAGVFGAFDAGPVTLLGEVDYFDDDEHRRRHQAHGHARRGRLEDRAGPQSQAHVRVVRARSRRRRGRTDAHQPAVRVVAHPVHPAARPGYASTTAFRRTTTRTGRRHFCNCTASSETERSRGALIAHIAVRRAGRGL